MHSSPTSNFALGTPSPASRYRVANVVHAQSYDVTRRYISLTTLLLLLLRLQSCADASGCVRTPALSNVNFVTSPGAVCLVSTFIHSDVDVGANVTGNA